MIHNDFFKDLYFKITSGVTYTDILTDRFNPHRMLMGQPCWENSDSMTIKKPKTLILHDWTMKHWSFKKKQDVIEKLRELIRKGFSIYQYSPHDLPQLTLENIEHILWHGYALTPVVSLSEIIAFAAKKEITPQQMYWLDDYAITRLYVEENTIFRAIKLEHVVLLNEDELATLYELLSTSTCPPTHVLINHREDFHAPAALAIKDSKLYEYLNSLESITDPISDDKLVYSKLIDLSDNESFCFDSCESFSGFEQIDTSTIHKIEFKNATPSTMMVNHLRFCTQLTNLVITQIRGDYWGDLVFKSLEPGSLPFIEKIEILLTDLNIADLCYLLSAASNVQEIKLHTVNFYRYEDKDVPVGFTIPLVSLNRLKKLTITLDARNIQNTDDSSDVLIKLILNNLRHLMLYVVIPAAQNIYDLDMNFSTRNIDLSLEGENGDNLADVVLSTLRSLDNLTFPQLTHLEINSLNPETNELLEHFFHKLIFMSPNLKHLRLHDTNLLTPDGEYALMNLECLHTADYFYFCSLGLMERAENLKKVILELYYPPITTKETVDHALLRDQNVNIRFFEIKNMETANNPFLEIPLVQLMELLFMMPDLETLRMEKIHITHDQSAVYLEDEDSSDQISQITEQMLFNKMSERILLNGLINIEIHAGKIDNNVLKYLHKIAPNAQIHKKISQSSVNEIPSSFKHNLKSHFKDNRINPDTFSFVFRNTYQDYSQTMLIEKISQYCTVTQHYLNIVPYIQLGICSALSHLFIDYFQTQGDAFETNESSLSIPEMFNDLGNDPFDTHHAVQYLDKPYRQEVLFYKKLVEKIRDWNGGQETLNNELIDYFELIISYIDKYQISSKTDSTRLYLGDNPLDYISKQKIDHPFLLANSWHAVAMVKKSDDFYIYFNPNRPFVLSVGANTLQSILQDELGQVIFFVNAPKMIDSTIKISDIGNFIGGGGLINMLIIHHGQLLTITKQAIQDLREKKISIENLAGLFLKSINNIPAWYSLQKSLISFQSNIKLHIEQFGPSSIIEPNDCLSPDKVRELIQKNPELKLPEHRKLFLSITLNYYLSIFITTVFQAYKENHTDSSDKNSLFDMKSIKIKPINKPILELEINRKTKIEELKKRLLEESDESVKEEKQQAPTIQYKQVLSDECDDRYFIKTPTDCFNLVDRISDKSSPTKSYLIECSSSTVVDEISVLLQSHLIQKNNIDCFYIREPHDLMCSGSYLERRGEIGQIKKGPGGPFYNFIQQHQQQISLLLIDYTGFETHDILKMNSMLDKNPIVDGQELPRFMRIIGIRNTNSPHCYQGSDFSSRFDQTLRAEVTLETHYTDYNIQTIEPEGNACLLDRGNCVVFDLYDSAHWEAMLLGRWILNDNQLIFQHGMLIDAIHTDKPIIIQNGNLYDLRFQQFWRQLRLSGIQYAGQTIRIDPTIKIYAEHHDTLAELQENLILSNEWIDGGYLLNQYTKANFYPHQIFDESCGVLMYVEGIIGSDTNDVIQVNVSSTLTNYVWMELLSTGKLLNKKIIAYCAPNVILPDDLAINKPRNLDLLSLQKPEPFKPNLSLKLQVIQSNDQDVTLADLIVEDSTYTVIDISECNINDLWEHLDAHFNDNDLTFNFKQYKLVLYQALEKNQSIILKGCFSSALIDGLMPIFIDLKQDIKYSSYTGKVILLTESLEPFLLLQSIYIHDVTSDEKLKYLPTQHHQMLSQFLKTEGLSRLRARSLYCDITAHDDTDKAWNGLSNALGVNVMQKELFTPETTEQSCQEFTDARITLIRTWFMKNPYVYLAGLSGVGKTSFIQKDLKSLTNEFTIYEGKNNLLTWAQSEADSQWIVLFIDEANLTQDQHSEFEGLFLNEPSILIGGKNYQLTQQHRVIFAGNPLNYSHDRHLAPFFLRHGAAVTFHPLSIAMIYEKILKSIFVGFQLSDDTIFSACRIILDAYQFICECSVDEILISPRDLEMMALLALMKHNKNPHRSLDSCVNDLVYKIGISLIPNDNKVKIADFKVKYGDQEQSDTCLALMQLTPSFYLTASRLSVFEYMQDILLLRKWRIEKNRTLSSSQRAGGLGAVVLEGEPGVGKSELVTYVLKQAGYKEVKIDDKSDYDNQNIFYRLPISMSTEDKKDFLNYAFHQGSIVVIEELNCAPMMEKDLNALLMGKDTSGNPPRIPGFTVIGPQNPIAMGGRYGMSNALKRRVMKFELPAYSRSEMQEIILSQFDISLEELDPIITCYQQERMNLKFGTKKSPPCFRDLIRLLRINGYQEKKQPDLLGPSDLDEQKRITKDNTSRKVRRIFRHFQQREDEDELEKTYYRIKRPR